MTIQAHTISDAIRLATQALEDQDIDTLQQLQSIVAGWLIDQRERDILVQHFRSLIEAIEIMDDPFGC